MIEKGYKEDRIIPLKNDVLDIALKMGLQLLTEQEYRVLPFFI